MKRRSVILELKKACTRFLSTPNYALSHSQFEALLNTLLPMPDPDPIFALNAGVKPVILASAVHPYPTLGEINRKVWKGSVHEFRNLPLVASSIS